jgi:hypothetical protein
MHPPFPNQRVTHISVLASFLTTTIVRSIKSLNAQLEDENEYWMKTPKSKTRDNIRPYLSIMPTLIFYLESNQFVHFVLAFKHKDISIEGIRRCFYDSGVVKGESVAMRRERAHESFERICEDVLTLLTMKEVEKDIVERKIELDIESCREYFTKKADEARKAKEEAGEEPKEEEAMQEKSKGGTENDLDPAKVEMEHKTANDCQV